MVKKIVLFLLLPVCGFGQVRDSFNVEKQLSEVTIQGTGKKSTNVSVLNAIRNSSTVSDGLSVEHIKRTPDRNVGDALRRVNGVTIQNDRFVLVRGLADRYNVAILNKSVLPTTEPDRRSFSFDIIPTGLIDNIIVVKSAAANLPGDFAGGVVQITTREVSNRFVTIGGGASWGALTTARPFRKMEYISFPQFPSTRTFRISSDYERRIYTSRIASPESQEEMSLPNLNGNLALGFKWRKWNTLFSWNVRNNNSVSYFDRLDYQSPTELAYLYRDTNYTKNFLTNGLLNISWIGKNRISLKTIFNHNVERNYLLRSGDNWDNLQTIRTAASNAVVKTVLNTQLDGKIAGFNFNTVYNFMYREQPDYRIMPRGKSLGTDDNLSTLWRDTYRFWSVLNETGITGNVSKDIDNFKIGGGFTNRFRQFSARVFRYNSSDLLDEITNNTDKYSADFVLGNGYAMWDKKFGKVSVNTGVRVEYNGFNVATADFSGRNVNVNRNYFDVLPSVNLSYNLEKTKFRLSASKTLSRPEFREVANFAYYDFVRNAQIVGNPKLEKTDIINIDAKWEWYPKAGENVSVGVFGKRFIRPIEQIVDNGSVPSNLILTYANPDEAYLYGIELEFRKSVTKWLDLYANGSLMRSTVSVNGVTRSLQGQSEYVANGGINLHKDNHTLNITYNRVGERISWVGFQGYGDIYENARDVFDIVYLYKLGKSEIKWAVSDLLAQRTLFYQKDRNKNLINQQTETVISLTLNINL